MWIIKKGKLVLMCTNEFCETTDFIVESRNPEANGNIFFICCICKAEYDINDVVEWGD